MGGGGGGGGGGGRGGGHVTVRCNLSTDPSRFKPTSNSRRNASFLALLSVLSTVHVYTRTCVFLDRM